MTKQETKIMLAFLVSLAFFLFVAYLSRDNFFPKEIFPAGKTSIRR